MGVPYAFANATTSIPLSQLDANFDTTITLGNTAIELGNTVTTLNNMTFANVTITSGTVSNVANLSITNLTVTGNTTLATSLTGLVKVTSGVVNTAVAGTDYLEPADIGVTVQAYNADTAFTDVAQTFTASQRGTVTTDNDGSFDQSVTNNFACTPTGTFALTFTNHTAGQSGYVLLDNSGGYAITAAATTKVGASTLSTISAAGVYLLSYFDNGTNAYVTASGALS